VHTPLRLTGLAVLSGLLLSAGWWQLTPLAFISWLPLLYIDELYTSGQIRKFRTFFLTVYLAFGSWNLFLTWWIVNASLGGALMAIVFNSLFMTFVFTFFSWIRRRIAQPWGIYMLIPVWMTWEYLHSLWDLTWTWLTLGNQFGFSHNIVQWYEYTGTSGGTFWILFVNILVFQSVMHRLTKGTSTVVLLAATLVPVIVSLWLLSFKPSEENREVKVTVVQPNIDPYSEKFYSQFREQFDKTLKALEGKIDTTTRFLVFPETFITSNLNEALIAQSNEVRWFREEIIARFPDLTIIAGCNTYVIYENKEDITATARLDPRDGKYFDVFNTGIQIDASGLQLYHKSKLVPGVERMPFPALLKPLESLALNMGGTMGSLGTQEDRTAFVSGADRLAVAPVICYESVYPDYVNGYIRNKANLIFIITNDGWWGDTPGYIQHLNYARLRAIESRRQIARSANTGISCFIDEYGNISQPTGWWEPAVITTTMKPLYRQTFFVKHGDLLSYGALLITLFLAIWMLTRRLLALFITGKKPSNKKM
jgi:apolipoprotein N-acyltransferase